MEGREQFTNQLKRLRKNEFYRRLVKLIILAVFIILTPFIIFEKILEKDIVTLGILLFSELFFIVITIMILKSALEFFRLKNSRIYQCIENPDAVTEIVITPHKIVFEIKGMEDETIFLKHSQFRSELITNIKEVFGENKIVNNQLTI